MEKEHIEHLGTMNKAQHRSENSIEHTLQGELKSCVLIGGRAVGRISVVCTVMSVFEMIWTL